MSEHNKMICTLSIKCGQYLIKREYKLIARSLLANLTLQNLYIDNAETVALLNKTIKKLKEDKKVDVHPNWNLIISYSCILVVEWWIVKKKKKNLSTHNKIR